MEMKTTSRLLRKLIFSLIFFASPYLLAAEYKCQVKISYPSSAPLVNIYIDEGNSAVTSCKPNVKKGCTLWFIDKVEFNEVLKMKKYYLFRGQSDMQIFSDLSFIHNDGQRVIRLGQCKITSP